MPRWTDLRLHREDLDRAVTVLLAAFQPLTFRVDLEPASSAPAGAEVELSLLEVSEKRARAVLDRDLIPVWATRTRLGGRDDWMERT